MNKKPKFSIVVLFSFIGIFLLLGIFAIYQLFAVTTVTKTFVISTPGMGVVKNVMPDGRMGTNVSCPSDCSGTYAYSTSSKLTYKAIPNTNYRFIRWRKGINHYYSNPIQISRTANETWYAEFQPISGTTEDLNYGKSLLTRYINACPILAGSTVEFGDARGNSAITYYTVGKIVVYSAHTPTMNRIIWHEIWHIYDYRDNGKIDWGENVPPTTRPACMPKDALM